MAAFDSDFRAERYQAISTLFTVEPTYILYFLFSFFFGLVFYQLKKTSVLFYVCDARGCQM